MSGCESCTKEGWASRTVAFKLWCWRRLLRAPWTARNSNQSIQKEINLEYSLEGMMLRLKFQYPGHLIQRADLLEKTLMLGKIEDRSRGWEGSLESPTQWKWVWENSRRECKTGKLGVLQSMRSQRSVSNLEIEQCNRSPSWPNKDLCVHRRKKS